VKRASPARPSSKDTIAQQDGLILRGWDLFTGVGTANTAVVPDPSGFEIPGQTFVPVDAVDHLGGTPPDPPDPPAPTCQWEPVDLEPILRRLDALEQQHGQILAEVRSGGWPVTLRGWMGSFAGLIGPKPGR
jgi:hypothetical protein